MGRLTETGPEVVGLCYDASTEVVVEIVRTMLDTTGEDLYEGRVFEAATAEGLSDFTGAAPFRSTRKGTMRRWWARETGGSSIPLGLVDARYRAVRRVLRLLSASPPGGRAAA